MDWKPIITAPKNQRIALKYADGFVIFGQWGRGPDIVPQYGFWSDMYPVFFGPDNAESNFVRRGGSIQPVKWCES
jgi:hypothetical protein